MMLYILKLSVSLAVLWMFYQLLLRRLTFYNLNRWYLLGYSVLCFFIPLIDVGPALGRVDGSGVIRMIPVVAVAAPVSRPEWGIWDVLGVVLAVGAGVLLVRLGVRWLSLTALRRRSRLLAEDGPIRVYRVEGDVRPFSFGRAVYLNPELHTESELADIVLHEYVHIRQKHSVDILFAELLVVAGWYNPFVWLIRHSIRQNLEFIADRQVVSSGVDRKAYQYHLLNVVGRPGVRGAYRLANNFNFSSLKKRIIMMNKVRSARLHLVKFLFVLPLLAVLLLAFRGTYERVTRVVSDGPVVHAKDVVAEEAGRDVVAVERPVRSRRRVAADTGGKKAADTVKLRDRDSSGLPVRALYLIDGKEVSPVEFRALPPADIFEVSVLKGDQALTLFGERGKDGVIAATTKDFHGKHQGMKDTAVRNPVRPLLNAVVGKAGFQPLYVIDGKVMPGMADLDPNMIESVAVLKDEAARTIYGERGKNGVIFIVTKKKSTNVPKATTSGKDGPMSLMADTIRTIQGGEQVLITTEKQPGR
ncbi:MAG: hypothetical protein JST42_17330 [Bacteroidetes bacterium]|nr:hypothetical protein [Bacteroidota bacterium]